jgi:hypothetical protein
MKALLLFACVVVFALLLTAALPAGSNDAAKMAEAMAINLCPDDGDARGRAEAAQLEKADFAKPRPSPDPVNRGFNREYNARLITCNRNRDSNGKDVEKEIPSDHQFADDLTPRIVKGNFDYLGFYSLKYAYQIERVKGEWIVTLPTVLNWPTSRKTTMVDIPFDLASQLGLDAPGRVCAPGGTVFDDPKGNTEITRGVIEDADSSSSRVKKQDTMYYSGERACRVSRTLTAVGTDGVTRTVLDHLREYWRAAITSTWNRPGFRIKPVFLDCEAPVRGARSSCDGVSSAERTAWDKDNVIWQVRFNLDPNHRPSFKRWAFKWNNMHTGTETSTIAHEMAHYLGLDDEYGENEGSRKDCENALATAAATYIMCDSDAGRAGAQGVYVWIITRRYAAAKPPECGSDNDCIASEYCDKGTASVGRNVCLPRHQRGVACSRDGVCAVGLTCWGEPAGKCGFNGTLNIRASCIRDGECRSGSCDKDGACQCKADPDCGSGFYCDDGSVSFGKNTCVRLKASGASCSRDGQCGTGMVCQGKPLGKCIVPASVEIGRPCVRDNQCKSGSCSSKGLCQCKDNSDCNNGYCDTGTLGAGGNSCKAFKREGDGCSADKQCGPGLSCKGFPAKCKR